MVQFLSVFVAGLLSFFSPCIFPLLPGYLSLISGVSLSEMQEEKKSTKAGITSIAFVLGFTVAFTILGVSVFSISNILLENKNTVITIAGMVMIVSGLYLLKLFSFPFLHKHRGISMNIFKPGMVGGFLMGLAFAVGWTPCIGPILAGVLATATAQDTVVKGVFLLLTYSAGLGLPFIVAGFMTDRVIGILARQRSALFNQQRIREKKWRLPQASIPTQSKLYLLFFRCT